MGRENEDLSFLECLRKSVNLKEEKGKKKKEKEERGGEKKKEKWMEWVKGCWSRKEELSVKKRKKRKKRERRKEKR